MKSCVEEISALSIYLRKEKYERKVDKKIWNKRERMDGQMDRLSGGRKKDETGTGKKKDMDQKKDCKVVL